MASHASSSFIARSLRLVAALLSLCLFAAACGGSSDTSDAGIRLVSPESAAETLESPPAGLVVLDVRTPEEFDEARLFDATMIDFYEADFAERLAELDRDAPYLMYCRSGNRSGQARAIMEDLGFTNVSDIDGGINAWLSGGHPTISG